MRFSGVIVLGPYRSGTSVTCKVLAALGCYFGPVRELLPTNELNPSGYFERPDINAANTRFIESGGFSLCEPGDPEFLLRNGEPALLKELDLSWTTDRSPFAIKDPRLCLTLAAWIEHGLLDPKKIAAVVVGRPLADSIASAIQHPSVLGYCDENERRVAAMQRAYCRALQWHRENLSLAVHDIAYPDLLRDPSTTVAALADFLGSGNKAQRLQAAFAVGKQRALLSFRVVDGMGRLRRWLGARVPAQFKRRFSK